MAFCGRPKLEKRLRSGHRLHYPLATRPGANKGVSLKFTTGFWWRSNTSSDSGMSTDVKLLMGIVLTCFFGGWGETYMSLGRRIKSL